MEKYEEPEIDQTREYEQCLICCEDIVYYAIGECGHNICCWNCILRQRMKMQNEKCPYCKEIMTKIYISSQKDDSLANNTNAIYEPQYDLYFEDVKAKNYVLQHLGYYCQVCKKKNGEVRKFPNQEALQNHLDKAHHLHYCNLCLEDRPVLIYEQELYKWPELRQHKNKEHPHCRFCDGQKFYDIDALYKHYRQKHYNCELCKK